MAAFAAAVFAGPAAGQSAPPPQKPPTTAEPDKGIPPKCARLIKTSERQKCLRQNH